MRLQELDLERFGHFQGLHLDFSDPGVLLHVIHGPNEAGKSTVLVAICDLLYGIHGQTPYAFLHDYTRLRIGATLVSKAGQTLAFKRRKGNANTLLKPDESDSLPDSALAPFLGGLDRETFERMFGLNHERLREGGEAMLAAKGELGQSLFEAGGGPGMAKMAEALALEADTIGSPVRKAATRPYWKAVERYEQANDVMRRNALKVGDWNDAVEALREATGHRQGISDLLATRRTERSGLERVRRVAPILRRIDDIVRDLEALVDTPILPDGFEETWRAALAAAQTARDNEKALSSQVEALERELAELGDPGPWPGLAKRIGELSTGLGDYLAKRRDLPRRERDLENGKSEMAKLIRQLGVDLDAERIAELRPPEPAIARVRRLISDWNRLDTSLTAASKEFEKAESARNQAQAALEKMGQPLDPVEAGAAIAAATKAGDTGARLAKAKREAAAAEEALTVAIGALGRTTLTAEELAAVRLPSADVVARFERQLDKLAAELEAAEQEQGALEDGRRRIDGELQGLRASGEVPTEAALQSARGRRQQGWHLIRRRYIDGDAVAEEQVREFAPGGDVPGAYEGTVAAADQLADRREREAARITMFGTLTGQLAKADADLEALKERIKRLDDDKTEAERAWAALWENTGVDPGSPTEMRGWIAQKDQALLRYESAGKAKQSVDAAEDETEQARIAFLRAATLLGLAGTAEQVGRPVDIAKLDVESLRDKVKAAFDEAHRNWSRYTELGRALEQCSTELGERERELGKVNGQVEAWRKRWAAEMPVLKLAPEASTVEAEAALAVWQKIAELDANLAQTRLRRDQIEDDIENYEAEVKALVAELGDAVGDIDASQEVSALVPLLVRRKDEMAQLAARLKDRNAAKSKAEAALLAAQAAVRKAGAELKSLRDLHGLAEDADIVALARQSQRRKVLEASLETEKKALAAQSDGRSEEVLRQEVSGSDTDQAAAAVERLEGEIGDLQKSLEAAAQAVTVAEKTLSDMRDRAGVAEAAQQANDAAAEMVAHVERWLRLRTATLILNRAVKRYREANQHPLVRRASEIFGAIAETGGNPIVKLSVDYADEDEPALMGFRRDGAAVPVLGMSDGTRDQLFLALRIAAIERYMDAAEPMPFIADDLFITSDDERTVPGVQALAELGRRTQVLLFTHHTYVVEAATKALEAGEEKVHSLARLPP